MTDVRILGVGMHPWGKWGRNFAEYGVVAARRARRRRPRAVRRRVPGRRGHDAQRVPGLRRRLHVRAGARLVRDPGLVELRRVRVRCRGPRSGPGPDPRRQSRRGPRRRCRHRPEGVLRAATRGSTRRPRLAALPRAGRDEPDLLRALRPAPHGAVRRDREGLRRGEGQEQSPRAHQPERSVPQGVHRGRDRRLARRGRPVAPGRHLRHERRRRRGGARQRRVRGPPRRPGPSGPRRRRVDGDADLPQRGPRPSRHRDRLRARRPTRGPLVPRLHRARRLRGSRRRARRPELRRGVRPVDRARARLVREHRALRTPATPRRSCTPARPRSAVGSR